MLVLVRVLTLLLLWAILLLVRMVDEVSTAIAICRCCGGTLDRGTQIIVGSLHHWVLKDGLREGGRSGRVNTVIGRLIGTIGTEAVASTKVEMGTITQGRRGLLVVWIVRIHAGSIRGAKDSKDGSACRSNRDLLAVSWRSGGSGTLFERVKAMAADVNEWSNRRTRRDA